MFHHLPESSAPAIESRHCAVIACKQHNAVLPSEVTVGPIGSRHRQEHWQSKLQAVQEAAAEIKQRVQGLGTQVGTNIC